MSSSVFKVYPSSPKSSREEEGVLNVDGETSGTETSGPGVLDASSVDEHLKIDSNLVIVVGKDGIVHVDQKTLHSLLANETNDTSVSVVRITSPTPSIEAEIEEERRLLQEQKLQQELESGTGSSDSGTGDSPDSSNAAPSSGASKNETPANTSAAGPSGVTTRKSNKSASAKKEDVMLDDGEAPHVSMRVEGFYPPEEAKKFAEEVLTLAGLRKPLRVETRIDYEFHRYVVANDHCYTPLTSPSQKLPPRPYYEDLYSPIEIRSGDGTATSETNTIQPPGEGTSGTIRKRSTSKIVASPSASKSRRRKSALNREETNDAEDLQSILEDTDSSYSEDSSYPEEDDNDSDLDFSITGKTPKKRKFGSQSKPPKSASKKEESHESSKKKVIKTPKKSEPKTPTSMLNKTGVPRTYGPKRNLQTHVSVSSSPAPTPVVTICAAATVVAPVATTVVAPVATTVVAPAAAPAPAAVPAAASAPATVPAAAPAPVTVTVVKKDHKKPVKPAHHVEALFSDMTSLFSTPDIIKKVGSGRAGPQVVTPTTTPVITTSTSNTVRGFVQLSPAAVRGPQKLPAHISIQTHTSASEEHDKRFDLIDSIVQHELTHPDPKPPLQQPSQPTMTEDIVKMLENNLPPGGVQESVLPITDNSILAALGSNDDGLPEDLLQHVAELAEHKELQEILDKQVLGVIGTDNPITSAASLPVPSTSTMLSIPVTQQMQPTTPTHSVGSSANPESLPTMTVKEQLMPRKEAIQIRRSDGRIITLPPIEAPATRSAKRRAQGGTSSSVLTAPVSAASHTTTAPSVSSTLSPAAHHSKSSKQSAKMNTGVVSYDDGSGSLMIDESRSKGNRSGTSSRRTSDSSSTSGRGKRSSVVAVAPVVAAAPEDDAESDESWNSEDDPDRLWCICMQPHNNRFMICCDACEEWFHGKCVNVTKAMGQQMEEDGVEWSCPNCTKKKQEKQQPKMTEFLVSSSGSSTSIGEMVSAAPSTSPKVVAISMAGCVVCGKLSRVSSVYCSDECIRKHAELANSSVATTTPLSSAASSPAHGSSMAVKEKQRERFVGDSGKKHEPLALPKGSAKAGPIIVMERKTGRCLTGKNAPTAENLNAWLLSHNTFEVVPPNSPQAAIILAKQAEVRKQQMVKDAQKKTATVSAGAGQSLTGHHGISKVQSQLKITDQRKLTMASPASQQRQPQAQHSKPPLKTFSRVPAGTLALKASSVVSGAKSATYTSKVATHSSASSTPNSSSSEHGGKHQRKTSAEPKTPVKHPAVPAGENIRVTVKKTLKEHLIQRTSEMTGKDAARLTDEEIEKFVEEIEEEMFALFNKDTLSKYRAKYRSLVFNIKDRKNLSLFQKICEKRIEAKQLVRMTPEELASQELAQWRENENKHQLEMIKKSELDLLACAKNYVLKTHKGEEVIERKRDDRLQLDPTMSVEDVVTVLNNSTVSSTSEVDSTLSPSKDNYRKDYDFHGKYSTGLYGSGSITSSTLSASSAPPAGSATASSSTAGPSSSIKKKESRRSRSRSRSPDRHKDRSRSRSKIKRRRSRSHDRHSSRSRDRDRHHRDHKSDNHKSEHHKSDHKSDHHHKKHDSRDSREKSVGDKSKEEASFNVSTEKDKNEALGKSLETSKHPKKVDSKPQVLESFNLVDQILASAGSSGGKVDESTEKGDKAVQEESKPASAEQDQEPTSTVTIPTPPHSTSFDSESPTNDFSSTVSSNLSDDTGKKALFVHWTGNVHMIDVASVEMSIRSVSGDVDDVMKEFPEDLDICGTIKPEIVWDYIGQIKKSINKEVCLVRFHSNESAAYYTLYSHLFSRKRYSVIKSPTSTIKDFYIFPLPSGQMVPMILKPLRGVGIIEGEKKPDLLLGIIVQIKGKRSGTTSSSGATTSAKNLRRQTKATASSGSSAVSPSFALMQQVVTKYASVNKKAMAVDPETAVGNSPPGSPGSVPPSTSSATVAPSASTTEPKISRTMSESPDHIDVDVDMEIIKAPIASKAAPVKEPIVEVVIDDDDDDEPYSPGGGSDDSDHFADVTAIVETKHSSLDSEKERIRREMEEINRKIVEEKNQIVGIINKAELKEDEIKSTLDPSLITDISIPSNLSEILASIKNTPSSVSDILNTGVAKDPQSTSVPIEDDEEEYVPTSIYSSYKSGYGYGASKSLPDSEPISVLSKSLTDSSSRGTSRLATLSEEELLSMVPDDSYLQPASTSKSAIPVVELDSDDSVPPPKKSKWASSEPPPPGLEGEMEVD